MLSTLVNRAGGQLVADQRVRRFGSHHQKLLVVHRPDDPDRCIAFVGGIDLARGRCDDPQHLGDTDPVRIDPRYGRRPPWHDLQLELHGPAVLDVDHTFRERWEDRTHPTIATRCGPCGGGSATSPGAWSCCRAAGRPTGRLPCRAGAAHLPGPVPEDPVRARRRAQHRPGVPQGPGTGAVAGLHRGPVPVGHPDRRRPRGRPAPRSRAAHDHRGAAAPGPRRADLRPGRPRRPMAGHRQPGRRRGPRVAVYNLENELGTPIYVHAKAVVVDDVWAMVGSANLNRRSWTHDSRSPARSSTRSATLAAARPGRPGRRGQGVRPPAPAAPVAGAPRAGSDADDTRLLTRSPASRPGRRPRPRLQAWHDGGNRGPAARTDPAASGRAGPRPQGPLGPGAVPGRHRPRRPPPAVATRHLDLAAVPRPHTVTTSFLGRGPRPGSGGRARPARG